MPKEKYENLPLWPALIAEIVCQRPYTGEEISVQLRSQREVERIEGLRQKMTIEQVQVFIGACDHRCKSAWETQAEWFVKCVRSKTNAGRDQLYLWIGNWLAAYLSDESKFLSRTFEQEN